MPNFLVNADSEEKMREILSVFELPDIVKMLRAQLEGMPPAEKDFYLGEIEMWGAIGDKQQLISDIINIAEQYVGLEEVMEVFI